MEEDSDVEMEEDDEDDEDDDGEWVGPFHCGDCE